ncbi:esterase-like activity of phytase family protein [Alteromonas ponticola]|uniref:Esterase-like activity of phytase family protein n=1 Tax=Alteromonas aquimaris TaxID=2998417 RepID=A0ABT3PA41_9ALTE|nr:hypothetical protein [Alteromonas aquimaris]MCW8109645.1 esterase-like activity of phytase family protein [Alteromonas aquimaris]
MNLRVWGMALLFLSCQSCAEPQDTDAKDHTVTDIPPSVQVNGRWLMEADGTIMRDPQPSGLVSWNGKLVTISDGSALPEQRRRLHIIDPMAAQLTAKGAVFNTGYHVRRGCFANYLMDEPDYEALIVDPTDANVFYTVTEDATRTGALSPKCQQRYEKTGSTDYPTLLVRLERQDDGQIELTHARPIQFPAKLEVGDFPNDGIEGMAISPEKQLYLALEKDKAGNPRIFTMKMDKDFWSSKDFAVVKDANLPVPTFVSGNHPINGLEFYIDPVSKRRFLLAVARNDDELWIINIDKQLTTKKIPLYFTAPNDGVSDNCNKNDVMDNASIEGLAVLGNQLWMINDPWKKNYLKNIKCPAMEAHYKANAPLLFSIPLNPGWFK